MILNKINIENIAPCVIVPNKIRFRARLSDDISDVMPYLNSIIKNAVYNHESKILSFTREQRLITIYPLELTVAKALNETDAQEINQWLRDLVNSTFDNKDNITPLYEMRWRPTPLVVYNWLPKKLGCRLCGEQSCLAFAAKLVTGQKELDKCTPLWEPGNEDLLESLRDMLGLMGVS